MSSTTLPKRALPDPTLVRLAGVYRDELVLRVARRDEDEPAHRDVTRVSDGMCRPAGDENEAARAYRALTIAELERRLSVGDVERLVGVRVEVEGRSGLAWRKRPDLDDVGASRFSRPEADRLGRL